MAPLNEAISSNKLIASTFPKGLVAVFVGGTSGVGEYTVKAFAKYSPNSRIYIVGRNQEAASRIIEECREVGSRSTFQFIQGDVSALKGVDTVCEEIKKREAEINILFLSQGSMGFNQKSPDGLPLTAAIVEHSRIRFIMNLLPLIQRAASLRRVISVAAATVEGPVDVTNIYGEDLPLLKWRGQMSSIVTLTLEEFGKRAPNVSFVHSLPGIVKSGIYRDAEGFSLSLIIFISKWLFEPFIQTPPLESGERHVHLATSSLFAPGQDSSDAAGVPLTGSTTATTGSDGKVGSGVYSIDHKSNASPPTSVNQLAQLREDGTAKAIWKHLSDDFKRITGTRLP